MECLLLLLILIAQALQTMASKKYIKHIPKGLSSFNLGSLFMALLFFIVISGGKFEFTADYIGYSLLFGIATSIFLIGITNAYKEGSVALTALISQYALMIPTAYGLVILKEPISLTLVVGLVFLMFSLFFINFQKRSEPTNLSAKWVVYVLLTFLGNGACSTISKAHSYTFQGQYQNEYMILAYATACLIFTAYLLLSKEKQCIIALKHGFAQYTVYGLGLGLINFLVLVLSNLLSASILFPTIAGGGIVVAFLLSKFLYKEKLSTSQNIGMILGLIALVFLNI